MARHLGLSRFHLVSIARDYILEHPERVISLVVSSSFTGVQDPSYLEVRQRLRPSGDIRPAHHSAGGWAGVPGHQRGRHGPVA